MGDVRPHRSWPRKPVHDARVPPAIGGWGLRATLLFLLLLALALSAGAADLDEARDALRQGRYATAIARARLWLERDDAAGRTARLITSEGQIELGEFRAALHTLGPLMSVGAHRPSDADWILLVARALQGSGLLLEAADWWLTLASLRESSARRAEAAARMLIERSLSQAEMAYLLWKYPHHPILCEGARAYAREEELRGHAREAERAAAAAVAHCAREPGDVPGTESATNDFFTIGVLAPLNGPYARFGISLTHGVDIARRLHNAGARFPLRLEIADTQGDPQLCLEAVARLHRRGVRVFVGELFSLNTLMAASFLRERDALLISPAATDSTIARLGAGLYACIPGPHDQLRALATCAAESLGVERLAFIWPAEAEGRRWQRWFRRAAEARGMRVVCERAYRPGTTDFSDLIEELGGQLHERFDAIFCPGDMRELVGLLSHCAQTGFLGPFLGTPGMGADVVERITAEFGLLTLHPAGAYSAAPGIEPSDDFAGRYRELYGDSADEFAHRGWVALSSVARAIEAGGYCPEALEAELERACAQSLREGEGRNVGVPLSVAVPVLVLREGAREGSLLPLPPPAPAPIGPLPEEFRRGD